MDNETLEETKPLTLHERILIMQAEEEIIEVIYENGVDFDLC